MRIASAVSNFYHLARSRFEANSRIFWDRTSSHSYFKKTSPQSFSPLSLRPTSKQFRSLYPKIIEYRKYFVFSFSQSIIGKFLGPIKTLSSSELEISTSPCKPKEIETKNRSLSFGFKLKTSSFWLTSLDSSLHLLQNFGDSEFLDSFFAISLVRIVLIFNFISMLLHFIFDWRKDLFPN